MKEAQELRCELNELLNQGKFLLRKWRSNSAELLHTIPDELKETEHVTEFNLPKGCLKYLESTGTLIKISCRFPYQMSQRQRCKDFAAASVGVNNDWDEAVPAQILEC